MQLFSDPHILSVAFAAAVLLSLGLKLWLSSRQIKHVAAHADQVPERFAGYIELEAHRKAATYTLANSGRVFATAWLVSGSPIVAVGMVAFNAVGDATVYAINDAAWAHFAMADAPDPGEAGAP